MATRTQPLNFGVGVYSLSLSLKEKKSTLALCTLTFAENLPSIVAAALGRLSVWVFIAFLLFISVNVFCTPWDRKHACLFWSTFRGFLSASSGRKGEIKMCLPTSREVASSLLRASLFVDNLYKQEWIGGENSVRNASFATPLSAV